MKITNEFTVHTPIDRAWQVLTDLEGIAPCMPGAQLTGVDGDVYQGKVKVKVGPVISDFAGTARFTEKDDEKYRAVIDAKGRDARSAGNASALVTAVLSPAGESTTVSVDTDLKISGKLAQFGSGMIKEVSGKLLAQFVTNLEAKLATDESSTPAPAEAPDSAAGSGAAGSDAAVGSVAAPVDAISPSPAAVVTAPETALPSASATPVPTPTTSAPASPTTPAADAPVSASAAGSIPHPGGGADPVAATADPEASPAAGFMADAADRAAQPATDRPAATPAGSDRTTRAGVTEEPEPLDLLAVAGGSIYKRVLPLAVGVVVVGVVIAWVIARR
jgi:carbon monoxide dehydrogenase subunit G